MNHSNNHGFQASKKAPKRHAAVFSKSTTEQTTNRVFAFKV